MKRRVRLARGVDPALAGALTHPEALFAAESATVVKDAARTAVARVRVGERELWVKRFKPYRWYRRIESAAGAGFARRSWLASERLRAAGFATAPPLAAVELWRFGCPADAYFVTASVEGAEPAGRFWLEHERELALAVRRRFVRDAVRELRRLHDAGFYSRDANPDNVLVAFGGEAPRRFFWIDLETIRDVGTVSRRRRLKNLVQLLGVVRERLTPGDRLRALRAYLDPADGPFRDWLRRAEKLDRRKRAEYARRKRHPA
jgi:hypothetical protein